MRNQLCRRLELKAMDDTGGFDGYASVFGVEDSYRDVVMPGAFTRTLAEHKKRNTMPKLLWQHDPSAPIGIFEEMYEDTYGLKVKGKLLLDVEKGREAYTLLKHKAVDGISIGYSTRRYEIVDDRSSNMDGVRKLLDVDLWEASLVTFPANEAALVMGVKGELPTERELERWLTREAKFSRSEAATIIRDGFKALQRQRDAAGCDDDKNQLALFELLEAAKGRSINN